VQKPNGDIIEYVYDGNGNRFSKTVNGVTRYYSYDTGGNIVSEYEKNGETINTLVRYVRDNSGKAISMLQGSNTYYFIYNGHGDVTGLTDQNGAAVATYNYDEFGNLTSSTGAVYNSLRYSGANNAYYDEETSLYKMGVRYYQSDVGRWLTRDSYKGEQENLQSKNKYVYVENNPITSFDDTGYKKADNKWPKEYVGTRKVLWFWPFGGGAATVKASAVLTMYKNSGSRASMSVLVYGAQGRKYDIFGFTYARKKKDEIPMGEANEKFGSLWPDDSAITAKKALTNFVDLRYGRPYKTRFQVWNGVPKGDSHLLPWGPKSAYIKRFRRRR